MSAVSVLVAVCLTVCVSLSACLSACIKLYVRWLPRCISHARLAPMCRYPSGYVPEAGWDWSALQSFQIELTPSA